MSTFKAFRIHETSGKISAGFEQISLDQLSPGEVVVQVQYSGINYKDALAATGAGRILRRGVNSIQLFHDGARWWIVSVLWDNERDGVAVPADWR